ncbi:hypothetical protein NIE88_06740 [Sporolactobacillus shoreicorticis]|uniref:Uncharacterized protein n=1 Tax=Sporolactobacillus shoreicorticis TaxID=1923877 RepID=A0ABW5S8V0_9BACL|nr:hypothetical protein [Sporolactobacillus shoreicorticis]MCO7125465.1 hypothetical protein [Sporolactobacillus shoreicorticis]
MIRNIYLITIASYFLSTLLPHIIYLQHLVSFLCMLAVFISFRHVRGLALFFGTLFLSAGILMLTVSKSGIAGFITSFGEMIQMVTLFAIIPILSLPIRYGNYAKEVSGFINSKVKGTGQLYALTSFVSYFFSSFMNLAALPMTYYSISDSLTNFQVENQKRYLSRAITHGYAMPLLWSPITPIVGTVLYLTGTAYVKILPYLIFLSICGLLLDWATGNHLFRSISWKRHGRKPQKETAAALQEPSAPKSYRFSKFFHIAGAIISLNVLIVVLDHFVAVSFLFLVSLIVIPFAYLWCLLIGQAHPFLSGVRNHFTRYIPRMQNQFFIFLTAGFFITALHVSHSDILVTYWVEDLIQFTGIRLFLVFLPLIPFALAFIGLHPAVGLALIADSLQTQVLQQSPIVVTIAMLGGAIPAFLMGPYNATLGMMSSLIDEKPFTLSNWNFNFTCLYLIFLTLFTQLLYSLL